MKVTRYLLLSFIVIILWFPIKAFAYKERLILAMTVETCSMRMEADDQSQTLRLRILPNLPCHLTKTAMQTILKAVFSETDPPKLKGPYTSLFLGRLMEYPWLSEYLATFAFKDSQWDTKKGSPVAMDLHQYVRTILAKKEITEQFEETFDDSGYRIVSVSVEKVGVCSFRDIPFYEGPMLPGKVPYDAMIWLNLKKM